MEAMSSHSKLFVPALPTLWPSMLWGRGRSRPRFQPFASPNVRYFYFARNAVWLTVKMLGLDEGEVLMPAYHHGVEVEALVDAGATPRFYRVGSRWDVDLEDVERKIGPKTKALYLIHYAGFPGPVDGDARAGGRSTACRSSRTARCRCCRADGAVPLGTTGDVGIFCLYKTLPVPNGGALVDQRAAPVQPAGAASAAAGLHLQPHRVRAAAEPGAAGRARSAVGCAASSAGWARHGEGGATSSGWPPARSTSTASTWTWA